MFYSPVNYCIENIYVSPCTNAPILAKACSDKSGQVQLSFPGTKKFTGLTLDPDHSTHHFRKKMWVTSQALNPQSQN
jgi:hypothetical protein